MESIFFYKTLLNYKKNRFFSLKYFYLQDEYIESRYILYVIVLNRRLK